MLECAEDKVEVAKAEIEKAGAGGEGKLWRRSRCLSRYFISVRSTGVLCVFV